MILLLVGLGCQGLPGGGGVSRPAAAEVTVHLPQLAEATEADRGALERHLRASPRWEIREEPEGDHPRRYAVRREADPAGAPADQYASTLNGYYSNKYDEGVLQTRVIVGLGEEHGLGGAAAGVTRAGALDGLVPLELVRGDAPGAYSMLIVRGGGGLSLEIYEAAVPDRRAFTQRALDEVEAELGAAIRRADELSERGYLEDLLPSGSVALDQPASLRVEDGVQPGAFRFSGWANPGEPGAAWIRASYEGAAQRGPMAIPGELVGKEGEPLSEGRLRAATRRSVGYSADAAVMFRYGAEGVVYEGDGDSLYRARFELWFQPEQGPGRALAAVERDIHGWQR